MSHLYLRALIQASRALHFASKVAPSADDAQHIRWLRRYIIETLADVIDPKP